MDDTTASIPGLTVGRMVHYVGYPNGDEPAPHCAAIVCDLTELNTVTLLVIDRSGWTDTENRVTYDPTGQQEHSFHYIERA